jgi:hypothetical protein
MRESGSLMTGSIIRMLQQSFSLIFPDKIAARLLLKSYTESNLPLGVCRILLLSKLLIMVTSLILLLGHKVSVLYASRRDLLMVLGDYTEGVFLDYRYFEAKNITPQYEFGFGLSYTTFSYSKLNIALQSSTNSSLATSIYPPKQPIVPGGNPAIWKTLVKVTTTIQNTGKMAASEVVQLYVGLPGPNVPVRQLRGFMKPFIEPGMSKTVEIELTRRDVSVWNTVSQDWELRRGEYKIYVGASVLDIKLNGAFMLG